ncbi:PilW family protein [Chitinolyticbacter meiyuanensis]|uniref:PilW family protein n=1 Tax=Chitinolyticbacter meiyuanensis TaxID=682798 RepID=UPI0011E6001B|nr:PilW family protein [Chitinolyticbacter meiyuanensis]
MRRIKGFTIIELMIGLTLALLLAFAIASVYLQTKQSFRLQNAQSRISDEGNYALGLYRRMLSQAGYRSWSGTLGTATQEAAFPASTPFAAGQSLMDSGGELFVRFSGDPDGSILRCDESNDSSYPSLNAAGSQNSIYSYKLFQDGSELKCAVSDGTAERVITSNVVDYAVIFGVDNDSNQIADEYAVADDVTNWAQVYAARVCIVLSSQSDNLAPESMSYQDCDGDSQTATDKKLYRTFITTVQLRNRYK